MTKSSTRRSRTGRRPLLKDSTLMWFWLLLAFIILIGGGAARIVLEGVLPDFIRSGLSPTVLLGVSYYCLFLSRRHHVRMAGDSAAEQLMAEDPRPPVLYLRSFLTDAKEGKPRYLKTETQEEMLGSVFSKVGPFVALGKPNEKFPTLGAALMYKGDDWWEVVTDLMSRACLVVVRAGGTETLCREVDRATKELQPEQLLVIVPSGRKNYDAFRTNVKGIFPHPLPEYPNWKTSRAGIKGLIHFESDWTPRFLTLKRMFLRGSILNPLPRALQATLRPVYERLGLPWRLPPFNWIRLLLLSFITLTILYALYQ